MLDEQQTESTQQRYVGGSTAVKEIVEIFTTGSDVAGRRPDALVVDLRLPAHPHVHLSSFTRRRQINVHHGADFVPLFLLVLLHLAHTDTL